VSAEYDSADEGCCGVGVGGVCVPVTSVVPGSETPVQPASETTTSRRTTTVFLTESPYD
jgi:hypothetical protein